MRHILQLCVLVAFGLVCLLPQPLSAAPVPQSGPHGWMEGFSLVLLSTDDLETFIAAREGVEASGARVALAIPPRVIMGWVPAELSGSVAALPGVSGIYREPVPEASLGLLDETTGNAVAFFNSVASGELRERKERLRREELSRIGREPLHRPLIDDSFEQPPLETEAYLENLRSVGMDVEQELFRLSEGGSVLGVLGNSDDMVGTVTVTMFFVESDGSMDPDQYTWTTAATNATVNNAIAGLAWWSAQAAAYDKPLSFTVYYFPGTDSRCQTGYEPILHTSSEAQFWVSEIMASFGYSLGSHTTRVNSYNTWAKSNYGTDWAYSIFTEYNPPPAPSEFTNGYAAWAYLGGPYTNILYRTFSWPFESVVTHESGHIFWACDEYYSPGYGGCTSCGYCSHGVDNGNCEYCNPQSVSCMMKSNSDALCAYTPGHIGWLMGPIVKYFSHEIDDAGGNGNGGVDPGESVTMDVTLKNWGSGVSSVSATLSTTDPYVTITGSYSTYADMPLNGTATSSTPYAFTASPSTPLGHLATLTLNVVGAGYDTTTSFEIHIGEEPILLVDDDAGASYQTRYTAALSGGGYNYAYWNVDTQGSPPLSELNKRQVVIWYTCQERFLTLTGVDETNLKNYLNAGGTLFFSSMDYFWERFGWFANDYLHVDAFTADVWSSSETGVAGDAVSNGLNLTMNYPFTNYSDDITPGTGAVSIFTNSTGNPGALRYPGTGTAPYKVVYFAFPFEAISNGVPPNDRTTVMSRVVDWLLAPQDYEPPSVTLGTPNGGEQWEVGSEYEITWVATDNETVDSVSLFYSRDGGATFPDTIATEEANDSTYTWTIPDTPSDSCVVRIVAHDSSLNSASDLSDAFFSIKNLTDVRETPEVAWFGLLQNYPNPFNPLTRIEFQLERAGPVTLRVYDVSGKLVKTLVQGTADPGRHTVLWRGEDERGKPVASGIYVYTLEAGGMSASRKMVLLK
ncbi:MAG: T9SS type A sorting domain-containing protein [Candidatus Eiseniibacteriota bacterium]|nr:MAG: T9SS type A sorting domain-containing protein [Candidatus Eisenbacteria bacterium]